MLKHIGKYLWKTKGSGGKGGEVQAQILHLVKLVFKTVKLRYFE